MNDNSNILGCYVSISSGNYDDDLKTKEIASEQGKLFRSHIWGEKGICDTFKKLKREDYGSDMMLILFQFYVNPLPIQLQNLKEIESYRKKEKSIGIPIIVTEKNFFCKSENARHDFLYQSIIQKLDTLADVVKKKKLDTKITLLKSDLQKLLKEA